MKTPEEVARAIVETIVDDSADWPDAIHLVSGAITAAREDGAREERVRGAKIAAKESAQGWNDAVDHEEKGDDDLAMASEAAAMAAERIRVAIASGAKP